MESIGFTTLTIHLNLEIFVPAAREDAASALYEVADPRVAAARVTSQGSGGSAVWDHVADLELLALGVRLPGTVLLQSRRRHQGVAITAYWTETK